MWRQSLWIYWFRNPFAGSFSDDGAMNVVVRAWIRS